MYKEVLTSIYKNEDQRKYSEEEALNLLKKFLMEKSEEYPDLDVDQLEKNFKQAFKTGLTVLGLIHGAHFMGNNADAQKPKTQDQVKQEKNQVQQARMNARKEGDSLYAKNRNQSIDSFLNAISMNESSGGKNTKHKRLNSGIHAGDSAVGSYGLMPNTIKELAGSMGEASGLSHYRKMDNKQIEAEMSKNPEHQKQFAMHLANKLHQKFKGDENKMAYAWNQGHNLKEDHFSTKHKDYKKHDYVQKYIKHRSGFEKKPNEPDLQQPQQPQEDRISSNN